MSEYKQAVLTREAMDVIEAAEAYCDQLYSFNDIGHPEVHKQRLRLAEAVSRRYEVPADKQMPIVVEMVSE